MRESKKNTENQLNGNEIMDNVNNNSTQNLNTLPGLDDFNSVPNNPTNGMDTSSENVMPENQTNGFNAMPDNSANANLNTLPGLDSFEPNNGANENASYTHNPVTNDMDFNYGQNNQKYDMNTNQNFDPNANQSYDPNQMNMNQNIYGQNMNQGYDMNTNQNFDPNANQSYDPNQMNMNQNIYGQDMNQMNQNADIYGQNMNQGYDSNQMNMNQMNMNQNIYGQDMNQMNPNTDIYGQNMNQGYDSNQMNMNQNIYGQDMNQMNPNTDIYGQNMNQGYDQNQINMNQNIYGQDMNQMNSNANSGFESNMNSNFGQSQMNQSNNQEFGTVEQNTYNTSNTEGTMNLQEEDFTRKWMGSIYDKAQKSKFNWCAAFFKYNYMLYRKMYLTGALLLAFEEVIIMLEILLAKSNAILALTIGFIIEVILFVGCGLGFYPLYKANIKKAFKISQSNSTNPIDPSKNGGTSVVALILSIVISAIITSIIEFAVGVPMLSKNSKNATVNNSNTTNIVAQEETTEEEYNFFDKYYITYDSSEWTEDYAGDGLVNGNYTLSYKVNYKAEDLNADFNSQESLQSLLKLLTDSFTSQVAAMNMQVETNENSFIKQNNCYYAYIDVLGSDSISRYYFVALPSDNLLFQFVLTESDTSIDYSTNLSVIDMITKINVKTDVTDDESLNTIGNALSNETTIENGVTDLNSTSEENQNTISNETGINTTRTSINTANTRSTTTSSTTNTSLNDFINQ